MDRSAFRPAYLSLPEGELRRRVEEAVAALADCRLCPRDCGVDRLAGKWAACKTGRHAVVSSAFPHFGEEDCLRGWNGSGTIFFGHCNLRCVFCLHPRTIIATDEGHLPISEIFERGRETGRPEVHHLDGSLRVPTVNGGWAPISKAFRHRYTGELLRIKPFNVPPILVTPNHPILVACRTDPDRVFELAADDLDSEHRILVPVRQTAARTIHLSMEDLLDAPNEYFLKAEQRRVPHRELAALFATGATSHDLAESTGYHPAYVRKLRGQWKNGHLTTESEARLARQGFVFEDGTIRFKTERRPGIPIRQPLDSELAWLLGIYCAEGHVSAVVRRPNAHRIVFSVGHGEAELAERIAGLLRMRFGIDPVVRRRRTTLTVESGKTSVALLFRRLCGTGARSKHLPEPVPRSPASVIDAFLDGILDGDGWDSGTHRVLTTTSPRLARGVFELGLLQGKLPSFHRWVPPRTRKIEGRTVTQSPLYVVKLPHRDAKTGKHRTRWHRNAHGYLVPAHRIERVPYDGDVYNLEVEHPDHAFLAPFVAVGNCQNHDISQGIRPGPASDPGTSAEKIARLALSLQARGCHNLNFVTPEHVVPQVLEAVAVAVERGLRLPIVYNTSAYDSLESLAWMDGVVDIYMPDLKLLSAEGAKRYLMAEDYPEAARAAIREMHRQVGALRFDDDGLALRGLIVRHLVMPGMLEETRAVLTWVAEELGPDSYVNLMDQYYPAGKVGPERFGEIDRHLDPAEFAEARAMARELGLRRLDERRPHPRLRRRLLVVG